MSQNGGINNTSRDSTGGLIVQAYTAEQTKPLENARITISRENGGKEELIRFLTTNSDGRTPTVRLPAPSKNFSLSPNEPQGFYNYNIRIDYPGYYTEEQINVPIFPDTTAIQNAALIPLPLDTYSGKKINFISEKLDSYNNAGGKL